MSTKTLSPVAKHMLFIQQTRKNHLEKLETQLLQDSANNELIIEINKYRLFVAKEQDSLDKLFLKMGWA